MSNVVYESCYVNLIDGTELFITPLKIKYLREFMEEFDRVYEQDTEEDTIDVLLDCAAICMKQFCPDIASKEGVEDSLDISTLYKIIDVAAGIKINENSEEDVNKQASASGSKWSDLDIVELESELFLLGIWKDYEELETSLSMPELITTLNAKRDVDYKEKKFLAALQGVDLDKQSGKNNEWEAMKARVFSKGQAKDGDDILAFQGINADKAGFGIGMGLDYERL